MGSPTSRKRRRPRWVMAGEGLCEPDRTGGALASRWDARGALLQSRHGGQHVLRLLIGRSLEIAPDDLSVFDQEGLAAGKAELVGGNAEGLNQLSFLVRQQRKRQLVFILEG